MRYTKKQISAALLLLHKTGSSAKVIQTLGYPSRSMLYRWEEKYPGLRTSSQRKHWKQASTDLKMAVVRRCFVSGESVQSVSEEIGYTPAAIYQWYRCYREKGFAPLMKKSDTKHVPDIIPPDDLESLRAQMLEMQMEIDILKETLNVIKKDHGVDQKALKNREKAVIIDALKSKYSLPALCKKLALPKSSYYYQKKVMNAKDKYQGLREHICDLFHSNRDVFGYRRIHFLLRNEGTVVSEKVIRRIMKQERLAVKNRKKRKYSSYKGEISPAVNNLIKRDFHAEKPNEKWLTDITEFSIRAGKVYLSPIIDCLDGMPISWTIGTSPNAELANTMLRDAISKLGPDDRPIVHSDRGCHYRWPDWIKIMQDAGLTRSMSKKGCSPDNSACEGFFGHLKTEMFYGRNWDRYSLDEFIQEVDDYMHWYCKDRIKSTLGGLSPLDYRRSIGVGV
jgi:transposase InsO family protein/transposase-like protein